MRFAAAMTTRTDDELIEIVTAPPDDWEPEAVEAAKVEIAKRGIHFEPRAHPYRSSEQPLPGASGRQSEASLPLEPPLKFVAFILGILLTIVGGLIGLVVMSNYTRKGQRRRGSDFATWAAIGAAISLAVLMGRHW
jgi:hypothetical protein